MDLYTKYMHYIDDLRIQSKIKVTDFVSDICSDRQYRRYLSGESTVSQRTIRLFCDKLNIGANEFYISFHHNDHDEYEKVASIYSTLNSGDYALTFKMIEELKNHKFLNPFAEDYYNYCIITYRHRTGAITKHHAHGLYSELINYPEITKSKMFNFIHMITLNQIAIIEATYNKFDLVDTMSEFLFNREMIYTSSYTRYVFPHIYLSLTKLLWQKGEIDKARIVNDKGIEYSLAIEDISALAQLFYLKAYYVGTYDKDLAKSLDYAQKCIDLFNIKGDNKMINNFLNILKKDFGLDYITKINSHISIVNNT